MAVAKEPPVAVEELSYTDASRELDTIVGFFEQREVDVLVAAGKARALYLLELILVDLLGVIEQSPDEGRLAVVHGSRSREAKQFRHQK